MIGFKEVEAAYKRLNPGICPDVVKEGDVEAMLRVNFAVSAILESMRVVNQVLKRAERYSAAFTQVFYLEEAPVYPQHVRVAELALKTRFGDVTLEIEKNTVKVRWNAKTQATYNAQTDKDTALFFAVVGPNAYAVTKCLMDGANPNAVGPFGRTPVYGALTYDADYITLLGESGAKRLVQDNFGISPLQVVTTFGSKEIFFNNLKHLKWSKFGAKD